MIVPHPQPEKGAMGELSTCDDGVELEGIESKAGKLFLCDP
jgi:hypothetical protein